MGLIHRASKIELAGMVLVISTSREDSMDGRKLIGTFLTTHECSRSLISDIAPKPCMNSVRIPLLVSHSTDSGESMSNKMSPLARGLALMNCTPFGTSSRFFIAVRARLALATIVWGS